MMYLSFLLTLRLLLTVICLLQSITLDSSSLIRVLMITDKLKNMNKESQKLIVIKHKRFLIFFTQNKAVNICFFTELELYCNLNSSTKFNISIAYRTKIQYFYTLLYFFSILTFCRKCLAVKRN